MTWITNALKSLFSFEWLRSLIDWCWDLFATCWLVLVDIVAWTLDNLLMVATSILSLIAAPALTASEVYQNLPPEVLDMAIRVGIVPAMGLVIPCILIRIGLQLIPFVRLGS